MTAPQVAVTITADDEASQVLRAVEQELKKLDTAARGAATSSDALGRATQQSATFFGSMRTGIQQVAAAADVSVKSLAGVEAAARRVGATPSDVIPALKAFESNLAGLGQGSAAAQAAFKSIGLSAGDLANLSLGQAVERVANEFRQIPTEGGKASAALQLFGATGANVVPVLRELEDGTKRVVTAGQGFTSMVDNLKQLAVAYGAVKVGQFVVDTIEAADAMGKLAEKTGVAVEQLSVFAFAARKANVDPAALTVTFSQLAKNLTDLQRGTASAVENFQAIGLSAKDFKGLSLDQSLLLIANQLNGYADGAGKAAIAQRLFGRSGTEILPVLKTLAGDGFKAATAEATKFGAVITGEQAAEAAKFTDSLVELKAALGSLALELTTGVLPALTTLLSKLAEGLHLLGGFGPAVLAVFGNTGPLLQHLQAQQDAQQQAEIQKQFADVSGGSSSTAPAKPEILIPDAAALRALLAARLAAVQSELTRETNAFQGAQSLIGQIQAAAYAQGKTSLDGYFADRQRIIQENAKQEEDALTKQLTTVRATPLPATATEPERIAHLQQIKDLEAKIGQTNLDANTKILILMEQRRLAELALEQQIRGFEQSEAGARGDTLGPAIQNAEEQARQFKLALEQQLGPGFDQEIAARVTAFQAALVNAAQFTAAQHQADQLFTGLGTQEAALNEQARQGLLSQKDAENEILALERQRVPELRAIAEQMKAFGEALGNQDMVNQADALLERLDGLGVKINDAKVAAKNFADNLGQIAEQGAINLLATIGQANSLADAFSNIAAEVQRLAAQLIVLQIKQALFGQSDGGSDKLIAASAGLGTSAIALGSSGGILLSAAAGLTAAAAALTVAGAAQQATSIGNIVAALPTHASGGLVSGPGTPTSDSIFARLSRGEFVIRAAAVDYYGPALFQALNGMRSPNFRRIEGLPAFAEGGFVGTPIAAPSAAELHRVEIGVADGLIVRHIESLAGQKAIVRVVKAKAKAITTALGIK